MKTGVTQVSYDEPINIKERRNVEGKDEVFEKMNGVLKNISIDAAK